MSKEKKQPTVTVNTAWCKGCGICVEFCPQDVLALDGQYASVVNIDRCTACGMCEIRCPDFAITVEKSS
ncbi:4Fe-4S binding protein [candidate division KSB1 bacterium]|nr:4Fe-4S binding protein [candidate division KSB1 bacterium]